MEYGSQTERLLSKEGAAGAVVQSETDVVAINVKQEAKSEAGSKDFTSFCDVFTKISGLAIPMGLSFTFSFEVFLAILLLQRLSESDDERAASTLVSTFMNTTVILAASPILALAYVLKEKLGEWKESKKSKQTTSVEDLPSSPLAQQSPVSIAVMDDEDESGRKDEKIDGLREKIENTNIYGLLISAAVTVPSLPILYFSEGIFKDVFSQKSTVASSAAEFLVPYSFAIPGVMSRASFEQVMFSFGKTKEAMYLGLGSLGVGTSLAVLLGFGAEVGSITIPKMGPKGIAIGFAFEAYLTAFFYGLFIKRNKECKEFNFYNFSWERVRKNVDELLGLLKIGKSFFWSFAIEFALTLAIGIFSGLLGPESQSAMSYNLQFLYFQVLMLSGFSFTCAQEMKEELGAQKKKNALMIAKHGLSTTLLMLTPIPVLFAGWPKALEAISGGASEEVSRDLQTLVPIMCTGAVFETVRFNLLQQLRALNDLDVPNAIAFAGMAGGVLLSGLLGLETSLGIDGVGLGYLMAEVGAAAAMYKRWQKIVIEKLEEGERNASSLESSEQTGQRKSSFGNSSVLFQPGQGGNSSMVVVTGSESTGISKKTDEADEAKRIAQSGANGDMRGSNGHSRL